MLNFLIDNKFSLQFSHILKIDRNCGSSSDSYYHAGVSLAGARSLGLASTFVGDIVKICTGGRIYVEIPTQFNSCCPRGDESVTSLTAHLVGESNCSWPISLFSDMTKSFQKLIE